MSGGRLPVGVLWWALPFDGTEPSHAPRCEDGDVVLCREYGEPVRCTVVHDRRGLRFIGPNGEPVHADAVARP